VSKCLQHLAQAYKNVYHCDRHAAEQRYLRHMYWPNRTSDNGNNNDNDNATTCNVGHQMYNISPHFIRDTTKVP